MTMSKNSHHKHEQKVKHQHSSPHVSEEGALVEHRFGTEVLIALVIFAMGLFFMVPFYTAVSAPLQMALLILFMIAVCIFVVVHWRKLKHQKDHPQMPLMERFVYLSVVSILSVAIVVQVLSRDLDLWLPAILIIVVLLKVLLTTRAPK